MTEFEAIGERLKYEDNGFSCRRAEEIIKVQFVGTEITRCKDCKHYEKLMHLCRKFDEYGLAENDFCSRGERKEVAE